MRFPLTAMPLRRRAHFRKLSPGSFTLLFIPLASELKHQFFEVPLMDIMPSEPMKMLISLGLVCIGLIAWLATVSSHRGNWITVRLLVECGIPDAL